MAGVAARLGPRLLSNERRGEIRAGDTNPGEIMPRLSRTSARLDCEGKPLPVIPGCGEGLRKSILAEEEKGVVREEREGNEADEAAGAGIGRERGRGRVAGGVRREDAAG